MISRKLVICYLHGLFWDDILRVENEKESIVYTDDFAAPYKEYLALLPLCQRVILCGDNVNREVLLHVLKDLQELNSENAEEKRRELQESFPEETFTEAYLYRKTNLRK